MIGLFRHVSMGADNAHAIVGSGGLSVIKGALIVVFSAIAETPVPGGVCGGRDAEHPHMARTYGDATRRKALPILVEEKQRLDRAIGGCDREVETLLGKLAKEVISDEDFCLARGRLEANRTAWLERPTEIEPLIADQELSVRTAEAVADTLAGVNVADLDLQQRRWLLAQLDFTMALACEDWRAKSPERRYEVTSRWAGQALPGESATRDYVGSPNALAM